MSAAIALTAAAVGTYALRALFVTIVRPRTLPPLVERALAAVGPAALAALVAAHLAHSGTGADGWAPARVTAVGVAALVAHRTHSVWRTMTAGMAIFWVVQTVPLVAAGG